MEHFDYHNYFYTDIVTSFLNRFDWGYFKEEVPLLGRVDPPEEWGYYKADTPYLGGCEEYLTDVCKIIKDTVGLNVWRHLGITE